MPCMRHQSRRAHAMSSGPLSILRRSGAPRCEARRSTTAATPSASMLRATCTARASRVSSSTVLSSLIRRPSAVSSNWKSNADTWFGRRARSLAAVPSPGRRRLARRCGGRCKPSWRQMRLVALRVGHQPFPPGHSVGFTPARAGIPTARDSADAHVVRSLRCWGGAFCLRWV